MLSRRWFGQTGLASLGGAMLVKGLGVSGAWASSQSSGYFVPAEDLPHAMTLMQWPASLAPYYSRQHRDGAQAKIAEIANIISEFEPVVMLMDGALETSARRKLSDAVEIWDIPTEDLWCRDSGPVFATDGNGNLAVTHLNFNGWGERWGDGTDMEIAIRVAERLGLPLLDNGLVGEGGGVESDGDGTLLAHESSWVNANRNPGLSRHDVESRLLEAYGADKMIWAPGLKDMDVTDYHIDSLARFVAPGHVVIQIGDGVWAGDPWSATNYETLSVLEGATDAKGRALKITRIPEPDLENWTASYVNYYVFNGAVLGSTTLDERANAEAKRILADLYPDREIMLIETEVLGRNGGGIHCATQQMPKV